MESSNNVYLLHEKYSPATVLQPRNDAPPGRIWCNHCQNFLIIGAESAAHQNLVRPSQCCVWCAEWNYLDEAIPIVHKRDCAFPNGEKVHLGHGGSQNRATRVPVSSATQEEAAAFP